MKKTTIIILLSITYCFFSCGNNEKKQPKKVQPVNTLKPVSEAISTNTETLTKEIIAHSNINNQNSADKKDVVLAKADALKKETTNNTTEIEKDNNTELMNFANIRKILSRSKVGQTLTQKELTQNFEIPEEAVKLVKSVTKTAEDEIAVKWHSTWFIEKVSDAKFTDARMKVKFVANKMYTSGQAIGIKYNKKIYNDLIIIGHSAYIPSVKGYHWQIGK
ncbi:hypothetical protein [Flavobacterium sp. JAS]|uniref:hypothetical protein n=1 Tax=Flavobacterium sp. JAS TaxID=2897329 RepID=UPI001E3E90BB|nr:hypothetical protein [Flavobacterium sp. JAS]MCD0468429.1 hypothetical protein [Flavobacterium sp. JAS]